MGSNVSTIIKQPDKSLPSVYCTYEDKCPSRNRSAICIPCLYKNKTGQIKPPLLDGYNSNCSERIKCYDPISNLVCDSCLKYMKTGVFRSLCKCTPYELCKPCYNYMDNYVFPPATSKDRLSLLKPHMNQITISLNFNINVHTHFILKCFQTIKR
jgi:hypothetical protein